MTIGEKIAHLRIINRISQEQLAEKLGVPEEKCAEALNAAAQPVSLTGDDENN